MCTGAWQVLVSSCRLCVSWAERPLLVVDVVRPVAPLPRNSAMHILAGLRHHPLVVEMEELVENILCSGRTRICVAEVDGAAANDKLHTQLGTSAVSADLAAAYEMILCGNHQDHLITVWRLLGHYHGGGGLERASGSPRPHTPLAIW